LDRRLRRRPRRADIKTFARKNNATARHAKVMVDAAKGVHTPENRSSTVATAAEQWLQAATLEGLERSTLNHCRTHVTAA
jgi:hypothetical protein